MAFHGFVDESVRPGTYRLTVVRVPTPKLAETSKAVRAAILPGQFRIHLSSERPPRQRSILRAYGRLDIAATVYEAPYRRGEDDQPARDLCLKALVADLDGSPIGVLVLDTRGPQRDRLDRLTLGLALPRDHAVHYSHRGSRDEPLLSLPDAIGWAVGRTHRSLIDAVTTVRRLAGEPG